MKIFISYNHKDQELFEALEIRLRSLRNIFPDIDAWSDQRIQAGNDWHGEIQEALKAAQVVILLVSPDFMASHYIRDNELTLALERAARDECIVVPVLLRSTPLWDQSAFGRLQVLPTGGKHIKSWLDADEAWTDVVTKLVEMVESRGVLKEKDAPEVERLKKWLKNKPRGVAKVIATRAALRVLPMVGDNKAAKKLNGSLHVRSPFVAFRRILVSVIATGGNDTEDSRRAARGAVRPVGKIAAASAAFVFLANRATPAVAARAAVRAAAYTKTATVTAIKAAVEAASADRVSFWRTVDADCRQFDAGKSAAEVMRLPIWHGPPPDWARQAWRETTDRPELRDAGFAPWLRWYEAAAAFDAPETEDYFGPELSHKIALQPEEWWDRGVVAVNADIAEWLAPLKADEMRQSPAARRFGAVDRRIDLLPPDPQPLNPRMAEILLAELRDKAAQLRERLQGHNAVDPRAGQALDNLLTALPQQAEGLEPGLLLSRSRSVETLLRAFTEGNEAELFPGAVAEIADVVESLGDLKACYPEIRDIERERRAQQVQQIGLPVVMQGVQALADGAAQADCAVTDPAQAALRDVADQAKNAATEKLQEELAGDAMAVGHNFVKASVQWALREAKDIGAGVYKSVKPKIKKGLEQAVLGSIAALLGSVSSTVGAIFYLAANGQTKMLFDAAKRIIDRAVKAGEQTPPPASPPPEEG
jgi:hypothetical protein